MRILGFFIKSLLTLALIAAFVYFLGGQLWMAISLRGFVAELRKLEDSKLSTATHTKRCQTSPGSSTLSKPIGVQLRFVDTANYQIELRCTLIEETPVVLSKGKLPLLVSKLPGTSGLYIDFETPTRSSVTFKSLAATKAFTTDTTKAYASSQATEESSPATVCTGWGYQCCAIDQESGSGKSQNAGVTDCPANCFAACKARPYIQSFVTDPYPTRDSTVVMTSEQQTVTFSYSALLAGGTISQVHIDYGDGSSEESTEGTGAFVHTYTCPSICTNMAVITAKDGSGNSSVVNDSSKLYIKRE